MRVFAFQTTICVFLFAQFFVIIIVYKGVSDSPLRVLCFTIRRRKNEQRNFPS